MSAFAARALAATLLLGMVACTPQDPAQRTVVQVNREAITVQQLQDAVERQPGLSAEQRSALAPQVLERLIDQELALQQAEAMKLERDPRIAAQLEAARRELLARAYAQTLATAASAPSAADVEAHYASAPALYAQRQVFTVQELGIEGTSEQIQALQGLVPAGADVGRWMAQAQASGLRVSLASSVRPVEQWSASLQGTLVALADGQSTTLVRPGGLLVVQRVAAQAAPISLAQARPLIEQQLLAERRQVLVQAGMRRLREQAQVTYRGSVGAPSSAVSTAASAP